MDKFNVALDGPAGAGKSTVARLVANALGFVYVDTGAMYRAVTWKILQLDIAPEQTEKVITATESLEIVLQPGEQRQLVYVDGMDVTDEIRMTEINRRVSIISQIPQVRAKLVDLQRNFAIAKGIVMDGRDIGTHVLPDAEVKIFLTASVEQRAQRRYSEVDPSSMTLEQLEQEIMERDKKDCERESSPLIQAKDAVLLDSTHLSLTEVVEAVLNLCRKIKNEGN